ncbi:MAG TPA: lysophospholipid acyltransferase family protein [Candidatus Dormibacteraeota bacterium]|nr:lysophospholipid acyltransferase family protein [Candidatus Dormibacteraeota bacterium]
MSRSRTGSATAARRRAHEVRGRSQDAAAADLLTLAADREMARAKPKSKAAPARTPAKRSQGPSVLRGNPLLRDAIDTIDGTVMSLVQRGREGSLDDRDPEFIERQVALLEPLVDLYFRGEVRHLERMPATGPVLAVGNHSGGLLTPDTWVFQVKYIRHFGTDRLTYALAHNMVLGMPVIGDMLRRNGTLPAHPDYARAALRKGAAVLVYPGGDEDVFRPWRERNRIRLARRTGFIRLALQERVPLVPVVSVGGHETVFIAGDGRGLARLLGLDRFRLKALPLVIGPPWGVSPGDLLFHLPLPAKITVDVGEPIDFRAQFGDLDARDPEVLWACYEFVERRMQSMLDDLAAERRLPVLG